MLRRALLLCGILSPILYATADFLAGSRWEEYSFRDFTISELGAIGAPTRDLFTLLLVPTYLLLAGFGVGVWKSAEGRRKVRIVGGILVGLAVVALSVGMFVPMRPRGTEQGLSGLLHVVEGIAWMIGLVTAMGFAGAAFGRRFRLYTIATVVLIVAFIGWMAAYGPRMETGVETPWLGVIERTWWYGYQVWFGVLAVRLLRERSAVDA